MNRASNIEIECFEDIIEQTAKTVLNQQHALLPNLQSINVIFPSSNICNAFRNQLLSKLPTSTEGIIPPWTGTLKDYLSNQPLSHNNDSTIISEETRRLLFIETLDAHPSLYKDENKWQVTSSLLSLFDELYLSNPDILDSSEEQWLIFLQSAYQMKTGVLNLRNEAKLIQTLWMAWQQQLHDNDLIDPVHAYVNRLNSTTIEQSTDFFYIVTTTSFSAAENAFIKTLINNNRCQIIQYNDGEDITHHPFFNYIQNIFSTSPPLKERLINNHDNFNDLTPPFSFFPADSDESEARAIDLQIRKWLLDGHTNLGIVCENRKLSRRVRALLERANIKLQDISGWSLATTSAAAVLESWLQCIEEDFDHKALLDLIKSHFYVTATECDFHYQSIYRLEHDIILNENISCNIHRYKKQLKYRADKLAHWPDNTYAHVEQLLDELDDISQPLSALLQSDYKQPLSRFIDTLLMSLDQLGITTSFSEDDAGLIILKRLQEMKNGLSYSDPEMRWSDFRIWLGINMETQLFTPASSSSPVALLTLQQSELMRFDALIIAATDKQHFPGTAAISPFFNQGVRSSLGLPDWKIQYEQRLDQFKKLLFSSDEILISYKSKDKGEPIPLSPWVEALQNSYKLIRGNSLLNNEIIREISDQYTDETSVITDGYIGLPEQTEQPSIAIPPDLIPDKFSASSHQSLINCPYLYFATDALSLKPSEEISDELQKSDYGRLIHRVLQAFHLPSDTKLEPFNEIITKQNKQRAIDHLNDISAQLFKYDLEDNALHKSWLHRWTKQIPSYISWQINHQESWMITATEQKLEAELDNNKILFGRIDRVDRNPDHKCIIDYKTGRSAKQDAVDNAEDVQLVSYALLDEEVDNVFYLNLDNKDGVKKAASLEGEALESLKQGCKERLNNIIQMTHDGHSYTAWGDESVCSYCRYTGICRKPFWDKK